MTELLNKQRRELELLSLSIELENIVMGLRVKQEAMDLLKAKQQSLMDPADLINEQGVLVCAVCHSVSQPHAVQKRLF